MLRVYAAAHGLVSEHHAVVEVGAGEIVLRVESRWVRFTWDAMTTSAGESQAFSLEVDGSVRIGTRSRRWIWQRKGLRGEFC